MVDFRIGKAFGIGMGMRMRIGMGLPMGMGNEFIGKVLLVLPFFWGEYP